MLWIHVLQNLLPIRPVSAAQTCLPRNNVQEMRLVPVATPASTDYPGPAAAVVHQLRDQLPVRGLSVAETRLPNRLHGVHVSLRQLHWLLMPVEPVRRP
jgi:hypothetical protein